MSSAARNRIICRHERNRKAFRKGSTTLRIVEVTLDDFCQVILVHIGNDAFSLGHRYDNRSQTYGLVNGLYDVTPCGMCRYSRLYRRSRTASRDAAEHFRLLTVRSWCSFFRLAESEAHELVEHR